jgi:alkanesulfonate monooxygenase SsuD/methylene tetrahydromethanopterin reductase-like flavin-dependent oxidoreductase (luciferase family)
LPAEDPTPPDDSGGRRSGGHVGTPAAVADRFASWVRHGAVDGFNVSPYLIPHGLDDIVELLVPALQERGVYRTSYTGHTLREHLGLRIPSKSIGIAEFSGAH